MIRDTTFPTITRQNTFRTSLPLLSLSPEDLERPTNRNKARSPKLATTIHEDISPTIKLPPVTLESHFAKRDSYIKPQYLLPVSKSRGSFLFEMPINRPKLSPRENSPKFSQDLFIPDNPSPPIALNKREENKNTSRFSLKIKSNEDLNQSKSLRNLKDDINVVTRSGYKTQVGSVSGKKKKHNQDAWFINQRVENVRGQYLFAVCDGHGEKGHLVSNLITNEIQNSIEKALSSATDPDLNLESVMSIGINNLVRTISNSNIDLQFSGSTLVSILIKGKKLVCANIGDSRAVIGYKDSKNRWKASDISLDHKPAREDERKRVLAAGGLIRPYHSITGEQIGPLRVWSKEKNLPGLAMTRSIGDLASTKHGIISEPEITYRALSSNDKFIILATDGLWEFISSQEAVDVVKEIWVQGKTEACCERLIQVARNRWEAESIIDDITVLVVFLNVR